MNHRYKIILFAALILLLIASGSPGGTFAQGPETPDGTEPTPLPTGGDANRPPEEGTQGELAVEGPAPSALVSSSFTYQGMLKNGGAPVNNYCDFIWDIFDVSAGGVALATDADPNVLVANGLFTASIDVPISVIDGNKRYVQIQVRCPTGVGGYTLLSPRQELRAVPYALGLRLPFSHTISQSASPIFAVTNTSTATSSPSFLGSSAGGDGVRGLSTGGGSADNGVYGETNSPDTSEAGVKGVSTDIATGGHFHSSGGIGAFGRTDSPTTFGGYFYNSTVTTTGGALYANGDAKQSLAGDGFVKAAAWAMCTDGTPTAEVNRYFNNVNTMAVTIIAGSAVGECRLDFGFDISDRYIVVVSNSSTPRIVTFTFDGSSSNRLYFWRHTEAGAGEDGLIMVLVY